MDEGQQAAAAKELTWSWTQYPETRVEAARMVIPLACTYAPLRTLTEEAPLLPYEPQLCRKCSAALNPYCQCDFRLSTWVCPLCSTNNKFPPQYSQMNETNLSYELQQPCTTIEYALNGVPPRPPPFYMFVVDLCVGYANNNDIVELRDTLVSAVRGLPQDAVVGVITFGTSISVHEMKTPPPGLPSRIFALKGSKAYTSAQVATHLSLNVPNVPAKDDTKLSHAPGSVPNCLFARISDVSDMLVQLFSELETDPWPVQRSRRQRRCTGAALSVAASIADLVYPGSGGRIMLFLTGPCTEGPGIVVDTDMSIDIRDHDDIKSDTPEAKHWLKSRQFYDELANKLVRNGHCVDAFLNSLDQVGFAEMRSCVTLTGGNCLLADQYANEKFVEAFRTFIARCSAGGFAYNATLEVQCSPQWRIAGATGPLVSSGKKTASVSQDTEMGVGGTSEWRMPSLDERTHLAFYFEVANVPKPGPFRFGQMTTRYQHHSGATRMRVTTFCHRIADKSARQEDFAASFDQQVSAVLMARLAVHKAEEGHIFDVLRWLDGNLIKLVSRFSKYERDKPETLQMAPQMSMFPQFMFHLRRSHFLQTFNSSPDETCFFRLWLDREKPDDALIMIQPVLFTYDLEQGGPRPCTLDSSSVQGSCILLLDTYFEVVVHYGEVIVSWRNAGHHRAEGYEHFAKLLEQPKNEGLQRVHARYPTPRFVECDHHGSQSRLLYSVVNPSTTHNQESGGQYGGAAGEIVYTDDASFLTFREHLRKRAVQN